MSSHGKRKVSDPYLVVMKVMGVVRRTTGERTKKKARRDGNQSSAVRLGGLELEMKDMENRDPTGSGIGWRKRPKR